MKNTQLIKKIIQRAIDIHVHIGPEIIPRKYTVESLIREEKNKLGGCVLKNHFYPTSAFISEVKQNSLQLFGGIVLNNFVGGLNAEAIYAASLLSDKPIVVWLPTVNAKNFLNKSVYEIAPEWVQSKKFIGRKAKNIQGISVIKNKKLIKAARDVLQMIKSVDGILATGHISAQETEMVIKEAKKIGIKRMVITHPIYQRIAMNVVLQKRLAELGCFIEQSYSMHSIDKIAIKDIAKQMREVGYKSVILSSDVGQPFSPSPSVALTNFTKLLLNEGISLEELETMLVKNPRKLLGIE